MINLIINWGGADSIRRFSGAWMITVLCIDDEPVLLDICRQFLERSGGIQVKTAESATEASEFLKSQSADVIVCDYDMPGMDGISFLHQVRSIHGDIPFILFTGKGREEVAIRAINEGVTYYLQKGGDPKSQFTELSHRIRIADEEHHFRDILKNRESDLQNIFNNMNEGLALHELVLDIDGEPVNYRILDVNPRYEEILDLKRDDVIGKLATEAYGAFEPPFFSEYVSVCKSGTPSHLDVTYPPMEKYFQISVTPWGSNRFATIFTDITDRKRMEEEIRSKNDQLGSMVEELTAAEEELKASFLELSENQERIRRSEERLNMALESASDGLWDWDVQSGRTYFSPRYYSMLGYDPDSFPASYNNWISLIHPEDLPAVLTALDNHFRNPDDQYSVEYRMKTADGTWKWILSRGNAVIRDEDGMPIRMVGTHTDINNLKQIEQSLHEANRKLNLLSQITRHDILNKLTILFTLNDLLRDQTSDPDILSTIDRIDETSRAIRGQIEFTRDYQNLGVQAAEWQKPGEILDHLAGEIAWDGEIINDIAGIEMYADPLFEKVLYNLIENAIRYGDKLTWIRIGFNQEGSTGILTIADNGNGIAPGEKERIFERGYGKNTGLGLFLTREILSITDITIHEIGEEGDGALFEIRIPAGNWRYQEKIPDISDDRS